MNLTYKIRLLFFLVVLGMVPMLVSGQQPDIVGITNEAYIRSTHRIFDVYAKRYKPDSLAIESLKEVKDSIHIVTVFGTWCKDSKKYVPELFKILEEVGNNLFTTEFIGVDAHKKDPTNSYKIFDIEQNPTFIIFKNRQEVGRILEKPMSTFEKDLVGIINSDNRQSD